MYTALLDPAAMERLQDLGQQLRIDSVRASTAAKSGNPTSAMSAADLMAVLLARNFRYDFADPHATGDDHLIFSKGHALPCCMRCCGRPARSPMRSCSRSGPGAAVWRAIAHRDDAPAADGGSSALSGLAISSRPLRSSSPSRGR
jgi:Transketolase, thiamine diphosphate binding domain